MLKCKKCLLEKSDEDFPRDAGADSRRFRSYWCKRCWRAHYRANKKRHYNSVKERNVRVRYGLSLVEYESLLSKGCTLCGSHVRMAMDHCHTTGKVRGALCDRYNKALGFLNDDVELIRRAADYIAVHAV